MVTPNSGAYAKFATGNLMVAASKVEQGVGNNVVKFVTFLSRPETRKACAETQAFEFLVGRDRFELSTYGLRV
jgi:hypothetical protein